MLNWKVLAGGLAALWLLGAAVVASGCTSSVKPSPTKSEAPPEQSIQEGEKPTIGVDHGRHEEQEQQTPDPPPSLVEIEFGEQLVREDSIGRQVYYLPSLARIRVKVQSAHSVEARLFQTVGDDQEPILVVPFTAAEPDTWVGDLELPSDGPFHLEVLAELTPNTPEHKGHDYVDNLGRRWRFLDGTLVARVMD